MQKINRTLQLTTFHIYGSKKKRRDNNGSSTTLISEQGELGSYHQAQPGSPHSTSYEKEYNRLQENRKMIQRIANPKRDKLIQSSVQQALSSLKPSTSSNDRSKNQLRRKFNQSNSSWRRGDRSPTVMFSKEDYQIKVQNERMGKRIMNIQSMIGSFHSRTSSKTKLFNSKVNQGVKVFFNNRTYLSRQGSKQNLLVPRTYGQGSTVLLLTNIKIDLHPTLKDEDLLSFQILKNCNQKQLCQSAFVQYRIVRKNGIKFLCRGREVFETSGVRVWRAQGVQHVEVGEIQFKIHANKQNYVSLYRLDAEANLNNQEQIETEQSTENIKKQFKPDPRMKIEIVQNVQAKLRKGKVQLSKGKMSFEFMVWKRRFR